MPLRPIPLNLLTLYADLLQSLDAERDDVPPASISRRRSGGSVRLYAIHRDGRQQYIGTEGDPAADRAAAGYRAAAGRARARRKTITALKAAGVPAPDILVSRVIEAFAVAGLFDRGAVLIGTAAFQLYPLAVGGFLPAGPLMTADADLAIARLALPRMADVADMQEVLSAVDPTFAARLSRDQKHACSFRSADGFMVDVLTTPGRSEEPVLVRGLNCGAQPLKYLDYLISDPIWVSALIGSGLRVLVPQPQRYAMHKLIVSQRRSGLSQKAPKDLEQARLIIEALNRRDPRIITEAKAEVEARGPAWRKFVRGGLALLERAA